MKTISADRAGANLAELIREIASDSEPVTIQADGVEAVLLSAEDWRGIQETLYLSSIPGLKDSLLAAKNAPAEEFSDATVWE